MVVVLVEYLVYLGVVVVQVFFQLVEFFECQVGGGVVGIVEMDFSGGGGFCCGKYGKNGEQGQLGLVVMESGDYVFVFGRRWMSEFFFCLVGKLELVLEMDGG